jgi:hypothetical protein
VLDPDEARALADTFGAAYERIRQDHLLSHLLAALSRGVAEQVIFFGGTALARTHLPAGRLSEDIDLVAVGSRRDVAKDVQSTLARGVRREYGVLTWDPPLSRVRDVEPAMLRSADAPPSHLRTLTLPAFAAAKTSGRGCSTPRQASPSGRRSSPRRPDS